jgi:Bifunctional DNA primase/polymerase, N-terminal/Protein of unknown function (DUF3987)/Primase C terminal 1 (PriCT-1)
MTIEGTAMSELLNPALKLLQAGKPVFPVNRLNKRPHVQWKEFQTRLPGREEVQTWWTLWPEASIGMATGRLSGLLVIDTDSAQSTQLFEAEFPEVCATLQVQTSRGKHFYFIYEDGVRIDAGKLLGPEIDIRGQGGFVIVPPSIHAQETVYRWLNKNKPSQLPEALRVRLLVSSESTKRSVETVQETIHEGQRNASLTSLAGSMRRRGMSEASIQAALQEENRIRCNPPLSGSEVEAIAKSVARYPAAHTREHLTPKSLCGNELGVTCSRDEEEERSPLDCFPVAFPEAAWSGLFGHWRDVVAPCTEAPLEFLWSSFLVNVGLMLGRNVWIESPQPLYPNFYVLLLGQTGDARKSTALWLARQLLKRLDDDIEIVTGIVSTEGLFECLAKHDDTRALGYVDELRSLLSVGRRQGTRDLLPKLNSLIYCPDYETIDRRKDPTTIVRPFFSLIAATAQDYVADLITDLELSGGMLNRFLMVAGDEQPPKAIVKAPSEQEWTGIAARVKQVLDRGHEPRRMEWSPEAKDLWTEFYVSWRTVRRGWDIKSQSLTARIQEHIQKIAVVYSTLAGEATITAPTLATAITIGEWLEKTILRLFENVGLDTFSKAELTVLKIVRDRKRIPRRSLQQIVSKKGINGKLFGEVLKSLEANGHIIEVSEPTPSGQYSKIVAYVSGNTQHLTSGVSSEKVLGVPANNHAEAV